jgi:hypothetical protein
MAVVSWNFLATNSPKTEGTNKVVDGTVLGKVCGNVLSEVTLIAEFVFGVAG